MSEEQNIPEEELTIGNKQLANEHFPEDSHAPQPRIEPGASQQTSNEQPETKNMEVHHHGHIHHRKKWVEYLFQFLMLFLAVFCGFLAENMREHYIEHKREKQYARQLLSDLRKDSAFFRKRQEVIKRTFEKSWIKELFVQQQHPADIAVIRGFLNMFRSFDVSLTNTTFTQMKTSGSLRYIGNTLLTTELQKYYDVLSEEVITQSAVSRNMLNEYMLPWYLRHIRAQDLDALGDTIINANVRIIDRSEKTDQEVLNITDAYRLVNLEIHEGNYKPAARQVDTLITMIKKEYHLP